MGLIKEFAAWIGLDWSDKRHWLCLSEEGSEKGEVSSLEQDPGAIHQWVAELRHRFGGRKVAIAVEQSRGPLIYALMEYDFIVLYPINPKAFANYRKALRLSGVKNDPSDARLLWLFLRTYWRELRAWYPEDEATRGLRLLLEQRRDLVKERTRVVNRLKGQLKDYYPQILHWFKQLRSGRTLEFLKRWPTLQQAQKARKDRLLRFFRGHRMSEERAAQKIQEIGQAVALTQDPAILEVYPLMVQVKPAPG